MDADAVLAARYRLAPDVTLDPDAAVLWVPRRNVLERLLARLVHRGEARVRLRLDDESLGMLTFLSRQPGATGREVAAALKIDAAPTDEEGRVRLGALVLFLGGLVQSRALVTEPI